MKIIRSILILSISIVITSCSENKIAVPSFNQNRAFEYLEKQVAFGPRVSGSVQSGSCRNYFYQHFTNANLKIDSNRFTYFDPYSKTDIEMVNVIASYDNPKNDTRILLMAHYDSRPRTDYAFDTTKRSDPIAGANDGASGVAVLMEIANWLVKIPPPCNVDLVLFDGEDWGKVGDKQNYLIGSREFARQGVRGKYDFGILLDMVGDKDQQIYRETYSEIYATAVNDMVFETAQKLELRSFIDSLKYSVTDDHLSLNISGVPAVDIIDFDYPYWHTEFDTPDKCSAESLGNVGRLLMEILYNKTVWPN